MEANDNETKIDLLTGSSEHRDKLERYFEDLYNSEIVYKIDRREIGFIQDGIETLVHGINRLVAFQGRANLKYALSAFENQNDVSLTEKPTKDEETSFETDILKIGSFYEHTQNAFPDEFDFVFVLGNFQSNEMTKSSVPYFNEAEIAIHDIMKTMLGSNECVPQNIKTFETHGLVYRISDKDSREIRFERYVERRDCSSRLQFVYKGYEDTHDIYVDIATGFRVAENIEDKQDNRCPLTGFANEEFDNNTVLVVGGMIHYTEKEVHFMKKVLSKKHIKVYRIMKYLINGLSDYDELRKMLDVASWPTLISNYTIKLHIIYHHYECKFLDDATLTSCILDVLEQLQSTSSSTLVRNLSDVPNRPRIFKDAHRQKELQVLHKSMIAIQQSTLPYAYEQYRLTPVARSYLVKNDYQQTRSCADNVRVVIPIIIVLILLALLIFGCVMAASKSH